MDQVKGMCAGKPNVEITFSEAGSATSAIFESMAVGGGGGGGGGSADARVAEMEARAKAAEDER